jgi:hypothetical protein
MQRQQVDDVGSAVASLIAVEHQDRTHFVSVMEVADQDVPEMLASGRRELQEIVVTHLSGRGGTEASRSLRIRIAAL